jgi:molybdopterin synthase catalytic subunit
MIATVAAMMVVIGMVVEEDGMEAIVVEVVGENYWKMMNKEMKILQAILRKKWQKK